MAPSHVIEAGDTPLYLFRARRLGRATLGTSMLALEHQDLPPRFFGVIPKAWLWRFMRPFANRLGVRLVNLARFVWGNTRRTHVELQSHARFNFLLDYVPRWKDGLYLGGGLIQYQFFLPKERARDVFRQAIERSRQERLEPWLVVMKRHRPDPFRPASATPHACRRRFAARRYSP